MAAPNLDPQRLLARNAEGLATYYNLICHNRGYQLPIHLIPPVLALADRRISHLMLIVGPGSGKSMLLSETYPAWELGHDPTQTIIAISAGELLVQGFMKSVMEIIEFSDVYHALFPKVRPDKNAGWSTDRGMFVTGRSVGNPDASYATAGLGSKALTGKHAQIIICDDIHDAENSATSENCVKVRDLYYSTIIGRADPRGARFIVAGRRWNQEDIYAHLKENGDFVVLELPAEREGTERLWYDITVPSGLDCVFSEQLNKMEKNRDGRNIKFSEPVDPLALIRAIHDT